MNFTSLTFVLFLCLVFSLHWSLSLRIWQNFWLVTASYIFYAWWDWRFCILMLASSLLDFHVGRAINNAKSKYGKKLLLTISVLSNLGLLGFFKYFGFFTQSLSRAASYVDVELSALSLEVVLPVGISFYTFQTLSYSVDIYRGHLRPSKSLIDYLAFVSFFPQLVAGPIERASNLLPQFAHARSFDEVKARDGLRQILIGCFKKMVLADNLAPIVDAAYGDVEGHSGLVLLLATVCFAFQIYYDFSGYSDIAIGTAKLFNIQLMRNFAYPYFSQSVGEFWRRWHISLSTWFRDYLYIPLGGNRLSKLGCTRNILITFTTSGFWHGAAWTFGFWGGLNGIFVLPTVLQRHDRAKQRLSDIPGGEDLLPSPITLTRMLATFTIICITWIFFRAASLQEAGQIIKKIGISLFIDGDWSSIVLLLQNNYHYSGILVLLLIFVGIEWVLRRQLHILSNLSLPRPLRWSIYTLLLFSIVLYGTSSADRFIYFQF